MVRNKIEGEINIDTIRKSVVKLVGTTAKRFRDQYGEVVLCYDDKDYWRREVFPYYKQNRKKEREQSPIDWDNVFSVLNKIRDEFRENFPYKVIQVQGAEADDVIATLCIHNSKKVNPEDILILSADKDFIQLHKFDFVRQYDPINRQYIHNDDPVRYLREHIIRGDRSDGIPNILTSDDSIVKNKPQKRMSVEKISTLASMSPDSFTNFVRTRNWSRNNQLINFDNIPQPVVDRILSVYYHRKPKSSVSLEYFSKHNITDILGEFA
jgi:hypothetical protein